jgi:hypothetical protein
MSLTTKIIPDFESADRKREILYFVIRISNSAFIIFFLLIYLLLRMGAGILSIKIVLQIFITAAVLFTPYIFYILIKEEHYSRIVVFFLMIIIPLISAFIIFKETIAFETILLLSLLSFYIYCSLIKYAVDEWIRKYNWTMQLEEQKMAGI